MKLTSTAALLFAAGIADGFHLPHLQSPSSRSLRMMNDNLERPFFQAAQQTDAGATDGDGDDQVPETPSMEAQKQEETTQTAWFASELEPAEKEPPNKVEEAKAAFFASELEPIVPADQEPIADLMGATKASDPVSEGESTVLETETKAASTTSEQAKDEEEPPVEEAVPVMETSKDTEEEITLTDETDAETKEEPQANTNTEAASDDDDEMSLTEILEVASEMEEFTKTIEERKTVEFTNSPAPPPPPPKPVKTEDDVKIETFVQALGAAAFVTTRELLTGILGGLRMTAANALTKSLPEEERSKLLERMESQRTYTTVASTTEDDDTDDQGYEEMRGSVAEEIAVAEAEQARLDEDKWEAEKEALVKQMEEAANARVETELAIQKDRLEREMKELEESMEASKKQLEDEKNALQENLSTAGELADVLDMGKQEVAQLKEILDKREKQKQNLATVEEELKLRIFEIEKQKEVIAKGEQELKEKVEENGSTYLSPKEYRNLSQEEKGALKELRGGQLKKEVDGHPVLGPLVCDLGYKRIYLASSGTLGTLPIWKKQRIYRHSRARSMAVEKVKSMETGFPGAICLYEDTQGNLSILDGQHRVGMMQMLRAMQNEGDKLPPEMENYFDQVLVEVYPNPRPELQDDEKHSEAVFLEINKAEPVKLVDMPGVASVRDNKVITSAVSRMQEQFPKMYSPSQTCRVPNVNVDNMRNNIFGANIIKRHKLRSGKQLFDWLLVQNAAVGASYECDDSKRETVSESAWNKASENYFYLGLESSWLYK
jgi:hypothetical protein